MTPLDSPHNTAVSPDLSHCLLRGSGVLGMISGVCLSSAGKTFSDGHPAALLGVVAERLTWEAPGGFGPLSSNEVLVSRVEVNGLIVQQAGLAFGTPKRAGELQAHGEHLDS